MTEQIITLWTILIGGIILCFTRRYKNNDPEAGFAVAGWTMFFVFLWLLNYL